MQIFNEVKEVIDSVMAGFNGTIMAYGQTSAGKSHTMEGILNDATHQGVLPRCIHSLFDKIQDSAASLQFQVTISYCEIYCEKIRDLLNPQQTNMKVRENKGGGFLIQDVTELSVMDRQDCFRIIELGKTNRATSPTLMNAESSRSHSIFSLVIEQRNSDSGRYKKGKLFLVDLAGSEKVSKTGASGMRLEEAKNINSSLTTLGMVINALSDSASHVPYRDSKLTMLLMEALGGNSKTTLIICCNPESKHSPETLSTLRFGERAKKIKNHAKVNEELSVEELKSLLAAAKKEINMLKKRLINSSTTSILEDEDLLLDEESKALLMADMSITSASPLPAALRDDLQKRVDELEADCQGLRGKISSLEDELETERLRSAEEHEEGMQKGAEADALRATIEDLESRLLKNTIDAKSRNHADALGSLTDQVDGPDPAQRTVQFPASLPPPKPYRRGNSKASSRTDNRSLSMSDVNNVQPAETRAEDDSDSDDENVVTVTQERLPSLFEPMDEMLEHSNVVDKHRQNEIKDLSHTLSMHEHVTRNAQAEAQNYAEKYVKLREEYEHYVKRLVDKLKHEQDTRALLEEKLEDAYSKLWQATGKDKSKGLFSGWFGKNDSGRTSSVSGPSSSGGFKSSRSSMSAAFTDREQNLVRSLELAQGHVAQLISDGETMKEAHKIVVETKESVMRNLARQNSHLLTEASTPITSTRLLRANITTEGQFDETQRGVSGKHRPVDKLAAEHAEPQSRPADHALAADVQLHPRWQ